MKSRFRPSPRRHRAAGYTLIEMVTVIALLSLVMLSCGLMMHALLTIDRISRQEESLSLSVNELTHRFRRDVHQAATSSLSEDRHTLTLNLDGGQAVDYQLTDHQVLVRQRTAGEETSRERYRMPGCEFRWEATPHQTSWQLHIRRPAVALTTKTPLDQAAINLVIEARTGRYGSLLSADTSHGEVRE